MQQVVWDGVGAVLGEMVANFHQILQEASYSFMIDPESHSNTPMLLTPKFKVGSWVTVLPLHLISRPQIQMPSLSPHLTLTPPPQPEFNPTLPPSCVIFLSLSFLICQMAW